jgi:nuclear pore complex protein Nup155
MYPIPDDIYNQYNRAQVSTSMGLFADLDQAWVSIDNALYLWDYTNPSSVNLQGLENQPSVITAVHFTVPREGVFLPEIKYLLVLATFTAVSIFGISIEDGRGGAKSIKIHDPGMSASVKGLDVNVFASSRKTGRIFFAGRGDNDVYELNYQQEERWFQGKATKTNHVTGLISTQTVWRSHTNLYVLSMCVDDSRQLLYTLSSNSSIRVFHMKEGGVLEPAITKEISSTFTDIGNRATGNIMSETLNTSTRLISISPIPSQEATKLHLMATTNTGYRIYFSATTSHGWLVSGSSQAPRSLQVQHVKLPPRVQGPDGAQIASNQGPTASNQGPTESNQSIKTLTVARVAARIPPGYFLCFTYNPQLNQPDTLFVSAVDSGRTARAPLASQLTGSRFYENQMWIRLPGQTEDLGMRTPTYAGAEKPAGFGYEPSMQFDKATPEIAILTNAGVHIIRRRRLVDIFAAFARQGSSGDESRAAQVRSFINRYGRRETIATALAVACGQGVEVSSDFRSTKMTDVAVLNFAREIFLKEGGKATLNENLVESQINPIDAVRPSPRHFGLTLYLSRLIRSIWSGIIVEEISTPAGGKQILPSVPITKLQEIQSDLTSLQEFLKKERNSIDGLSGSAILSRAATQSEELSYQGEHRDMQAIVQFIDSTIEGISFILVLFDERVEEIVALLSEESRRPFMAWTFKDLFTQQSRDLGKEVIKAVVNRNIAKGANVETIAEALRRRCGSFCSADDVVIFRAQELLKRASETGSNAESSRNRLNESLRLFKQVAQSLPMDYLTSAVELYVSLHFFAGMFLFSKSSQSTLNLSRCDRISISGCPAVR